jgi:hypothetical protein
MRVFKNIYLEFFGLLLLVLHEISNKLTGVYNEIVYTTLDRDEP